MVMNGLLVLGFLILIALLILGLVLLIPEIIKRVNGASSNDSSDQPTPPSDPPAQVDEPETPVEPPPAKKVGTVGTWNVPTPIELDIPEPTPTVEVPLQTGCDATIPDFCVSSCKRLGKTVAACRSGGCLQGERSATGCIGKCTCCCS